jgi:integrase
MAVSSYTRKRDGKTMWRVRLRDSHGEWYGQSFYTKADAAEWERREKSKKFTGQVITAKTVGEVAEEWLASNRKKAEGSIDKDRGVLDKHVIPVLGEDTQIRKIYAQDIQALVNSWWDNYHPETIRRYYSSVRAMFSFARKRLYISRDQDPCYDINIPDREPRQIDVAMIEHPDGTVSVDMAPYHRLAEEMGSYYAPMVDLALMGLRWGEIAGLQAGDIHFGKMRNTLTVERQLTRGHKGAMILKNRTKSYRAMRGGQGITIPVSLADKLKAHITDHELSDEDFLFLSPDNQRLHYSNWRRNIWEPARERAGMTGFHFHDLKHVATKLLGRAGGVSDKVRETRLGNSVRVQKDVYDSVTQAEDWQAANALESMIYGDVA